MMTMSADVEVIARAIWESVLTAPILPGDDVMLDEDTQVTCLVHLHGAFDGLVMMQCPEALSAQLTATMLQLDQVPSQADMIDAMGELANMFAGNVKVLLAKPSFISLPTVAFGPQDESAFRDLDVVVRVPFVSDGHPLVVTILQRSD